MSKPRLNALFNEDVKIVSDSIVYQKRHANADINYRLVDKRWNNSQNG